MKVKRIFGSVDENIDRIVYMTTNHKYEGTWQEVYSTKVLCCEFPDDYCGVVCQSIWYPAMLEDGANTCYIPTDCPTDIVQVAVSDFIGEYLKIKTAFASPEIESSTIAIKLTELLPSVGTMTTKTEQIKFQTRKQIEKYLESQGIAFCVKDEFMDTIYMQTSNGCLIQIMTASPTNATFNLFSFRFSGNGVTLGNEWHWLEPKEMTGEEIVAKVESIASIENLF